MIVAHPAAPARRRDALPLAFEVAVAVSAGVVATALAYLGRGVVETSATSLGALGAVLAFVALGAIAGALVLAALWAAPHLAERVGLAARLAAEDEAPTEAEIRDLLAEGHEAGVIDKAEKDLIERVFQFTDAEVRRVMVPRPKMAGISLQWPSEEALRYIRDTEFSRYPVYDRSVNEIVGFLYYKDVLRALLPKDGEAPAALDLRSVVRPPFFVPETMKLSTLLKELQRRRGEMAVVVNEHGAVEGLVTLEDILEQIVGPIQDEYDVGEDKRVERMKDGSWVVDASLVSEELPPELRELVLPGEGYETVAGFALSTLQRLPRPGESWGVGAWRLTVVEMDGRRIARLKIEKAGAPRPAG